MSSSSSSTSSPTARDEPHINTTASSTPSSSSPFPDRAHCDHSPMLRTACFRAYRPASHIHAPHTLPSRTPSSGSGINRTFSSSQVLSRKDPKMASGPPKHQMVYLEGLASKERRFGEFRKVLHTGLYSQLVAMEVPVGGEIGDEVHTVDQTLLFTSGVGRATVAGVDQDVKASDVVVVPAGTQHQFINTGDKPLELITIYAPAEHHPQTVHKTKEEGDKEEDEGKDEAPDWSRKSKKENEEAGLVRLSGKYENE